MGWLSLVLRIEVVLQPLSMRGELRGGVRGYLLIWGGIGIRSLRTDERYTDRRKEK